MKCFVYSADENFGGSEYNAGKISNALIYIFVSRARFCIKYVAY